MNRRLSLLALTAGLAAAQATTTEADSILSVLETGLQAKKGLTVHIKGQAIPMIVTAISTHFVEGRNQQSSKIAVRLASIDAAVLA